MKKIILFIILLFSVSNIFSQDVGTSAYLQGGATVNFLYKSGQDYNSAIGSSTIYDVSGLKPLPGFVLGITNAIRMAGGNLFFRYGGMMSYHVNSAVVSSQSVIQPSYIVDEKQNIKMRFRNLYVQLPIELEIKFGKQKANYCFSGFKLAYRLANASSWTYEHTSYNYNFSTDPASLISTQGPEQTEQTPATRSSSLSFEIGFGQPISNHFLIEERVDAGLTPAIDFGDGVSAPILRQITGEIVLGYKLSK